VFGVGFAWPGKNTRYVNGSLIAWKKANRKPRLQWAADRVRHLGAVARCLAHMQGRLPAPQSLQIGQDTGRENHGSAFNI
jgi:hypothetical protein